MLFIRGTVHQWYQAPTGVATRSALLPGGPGVWYRHGGVLPGVVEEEISVHQHRQDFFSYTSGLDEEWTSV